VALARCLQGRTPGCVVRHAALGAVGGVRRAETNRIVCSGPRAAPARAASAGTAGAPGPRYAGVLSAAHKWRASVVPPPAEDDPAGDEHCHEPPERPATHRSGYIERYLRHAGESTEVFPLAPARGPPFFRSAAVRRKLGELDGSERQVELSFGA
jgi:hypothetical protein